MTAQQQTIATCLRMNAATGRTEGIRDWMLANPATP